MSYQTSKEEISPSSYFMIPGFKDPSEFKGYQKYEPEVIIKVVSAYYDVTPSQLKNDRRFRNIVTARQVAMYLVKKHTVLSLKDIGTLFGNRDHTTVIHSVSRVDDFIKIGDKVKDDLEQIALKLYC